MAKKLTKGKREYLIRIVADATDRQLNDEARMQRVRRLARDLWRPWSHQ